MEDSPPPAAGILPDTTPACGQELGVLKTLRPKPLSPKPSQVLGLTVFRVVVLRSSASLLAGVGGTGEELLFILTSFSESMVQT